MKKLKETKTNVNKKDSNNQKFLNKNLMNFNEKKLEDNNNNNETNEMDKKDNKLKKKHTWVYDQLFVKNNLVDESFEFENEEEEINPIKRQLLLNKYNILSEEIYQLKKEKNLLMKIIKNNGKENKEIEENCNNDIRENKKWIEKLLRLMAQFTKDILELKKKLKDIKNEK